MSDFSQDDFQQQLNSRFIVAAYPEYALTLHQVCPGQAPRSGFEAFSLQFHGPNPHLAQATYVLRHEALGELAIFITPISAQPSHVEYEAVFVRELT